MHQSQLDSPRSRHCKEVYEGLTPVKERRAEAGMGRLCQQGAPEQRFFLKEVPPLSRND